MLCAVTFCCHISVGMFIDFCTFSDNQGSVGFQDMPWYRGSGRQPEVSNLAPPTTKKKDQLFRCLTWTLCVSVQCDFIQGEYDVHCRLLEGWHVSLFISCVCVMSYLQCSEILCPDLWGIVFLELYFRHTFPYFGESYCSVYVNALRQVTLQKQLCFFKAFFFPLLLIIGF